jgi:hypothetical protein
LSRPGRRRARSRPHDLCVRRQKIATAPVHQITPPSTPQKCQEPSTEKQSFLVIRAASAKGRRMSNGSRETVHSCPVSSDRIKRARRDQSLDVCSFRKDWECIRFRTVPVRCADMAIGATLYIHIGSGLRRRWPCVDVCSDTVPVFVVSWPTTPIRTSCTPLSLRCHCTS